MTDFQQYRRDYSFWAVQIPVDVSQQGLEGEAGDYLCLDESGYVGIVDEDEFENAYVPLEDDIDEDFYSPTARDIAEMIHEEKQRDSETVRADSVEEGPLDDEEERHHNVDSGYDKDVPSAEEVAEKSGMFEDVIRRGMESFETLDPDDNPGGSGGEDGDPPHTYSDLVTCGNGQSVEEEILDLWLEIADVRKQVEGGSDVEYVSQEGLTQALADATDSTVKEIKERADQFEIGPPEEATVCDGECKCTSPEQEVREKEHEAAKELLFDESGYCDVCEGDPCICHIENPSSTDPGTGE